MKHTFVLLTAALLAVISCTPKEAKYTVTGIVADTLLTNTDLIVIMTDNTTKATDTIPFEKGTFTFTGIASDSTYNTILITAPGERRGLARVNFIPQKGNIAISINPDEQIIAGTPLNDSLNVYLFKEKEIVDHFMKNRALLESKLEGEKLDQAIDELTGVAETHINSLRDETYFANTDNALGLIVLNNFVSNFESMEEFNKYVDKGASFIQNFPRVVSAKKILTAAENTCEGKTFCDFTGKTPDGKDVSFSDYVGKGKYVLVDFWASWCHWCLVETPVIKEVYNKYSKKGLVVIGVAVWDGDNTKTVEAMKEHGIVWDQIFMGDDKSATDLYGIPGIPQIMLFAPDGTIVKRDLRGDALKQAVADVM
ncbi:MAG: TlpA disulfide reductase family protein [Bacteroidales bacterium]|nr:TlpA disulfide reductase family protein [Bacteroidales bacterium]MDD3200992.1 TlpA disulfide reductase family protein [Bacteroidales bacterium]